MTRNSNIGFAARWQAALVFASVPLWSTSLILLALLASGNCSQAGLNWTGTFYEWEYNYRLSNFDAGSITISDRSPDPADSRLFDEVYDHLVIQDAIADYHIPSYAGENVSLSASGSDRFEASAFALTHSVFHLYAEPPSEANGYLTTWVQVIPQGELHVFGYLAPEDRGQASIELNVGISAFPVGGSSGGRWNLSRTFDFGTGYFDYVLRSFLTGR